MFQPRTLACIIGCVDTVKTTGSTARTGTILRLLLNSFMPGSQTPYNTDP
jgi:hypothetical protein